MGLSGFGIFFSRGLFDSRPTLGPIHLWGSQVATVVYCLYQYQHFQRVGLLKKALPYRLGLATFVAMVAAVISGAAVVVGPSFNVVGLSHIVAGFAVLVLVVAHVLLALWIRR